MTRPERTYRWTVERGMQRSFAALAVLLAMSTAMTFSLGGRLPVAMHVMTAIITAFLLAAAVRGWRVRLGVADSLGAAALSTGNATTYLLINEPVLAMGARGNAMVIAGVLAAGFQRPRHAMTTCGGLAAVYFVTAVGLDGVVGAVEGLWPIVAAALASGVVTRVLRSAAARADRARAALHAARVRSAESAARRDAHKRFQRTLHDDVAAALRAAAIPGLDRDTVQQACVNALNRAETAPEASGQEEDEDLRAGLDLLPGPSGVRVDRVPGPPVRVPAGVVRTVLDAVREVLANVGRHAAATTVSITLTGDESGFAVRISDDGLGFRATSVRRTAMGLRDSVFGRLSDIGGTADVRSAPGAGTTVELRWARPSRAEAPRRENARLQGLRAALDDIRPPLAAVCVPYLLGNALLVVHYRHAASGMAWLAAWYAVLSAGTVLLILCARRPIGVGIGLLVATWTCGGAVTALFVLPDDSLTTFVSWPVGAVAPMLVVLATLWRWPLAVVTLLVEEVVLAVLVCTGGFVTRSYVDAVPAMVSPILGLAMGMVFTSTMARLGGIVLAASTENTELAVSTAARDGRLSVHAKRIAEIGAEILPFLRAIVTGERALDSAETHACARQLEWLTRDELHIPGVLDARLRQRLMGARAAGCVVTVQADTDTFQPPGAVRTVLDAALRTTPLPRELTLSLSEEDGRVRVSLVCQPHDGARAAALRARLPVARITEYDTEATAVELLVEAEA